jgi:2,3-bisphosphoglycerate-independent phosphoglycerate mutase
VAKRLVLLFIDGIGLGDDDEANPLRSLFSRFLCGGSMTMRSGPLVCPDAIMVPTDPFMGVPGVPQSATGQAAIFTGVNAPRFLGMHLPAFPNDRLAALVTEKSLMKVLRVRGVSVTSANLYSDEFFQLRDGARRNLFPVSTLTIRASGVPFRYPEDYRAGRAVFADVTNELIRSRGWDIPLSTPEEAAEKMARIADEADFVFFEYFLTDHYGHKRNREAVLGCVDVLNRFAEGIWSRIGGEDTGLLVVSDHGNAEDMVLADHTRNPVPTILVGGSEEDRRRIGETVRDLSDVYRAVLAYFGVGDPSPPQGSSTTL